MSKSRSPLEIPPRTILWSSPALGCGAKSSLSRSRKSHGMVFGGLFVISVRERQV